MKINKLAKFFQLPHGERTALLKATPILLGAVAALRLLGLKRTLWLSHRMPQAQERCHGTSGIVAREHRAVERVSRATGLGTCLSRSLALHLRLRQQGIDTRLRIGVNRADQGLTAHAWLEFEGVAISDQAVGQYQSFPPIKIGRTE